MSWDTHLCEQIKFASTYNLKKEFHQRRNVPIPLHSKVLNTILTTDNIEKMQIFTQYLYDKIKEVGYIKISNLIQLEYDYDDSIKNRHIANSMILKYLINCPKTSLRAKINNFRDRELIHMMLISCYKNVQVIGNYLFDTVYLLIYIRKILTQNTSKYDLCDITQLTYVISTFVLNDVWSFFYTDDKEKFGNSLKKTHFKPIANFEITQ